MPNFSKIVLNNDILMDVTDTTATANDVVTGKYFYTSAGVKTNGTGSSGYPNVVIGTFKGETAASSLDITVPYNGNGYPIALFIFLSDPDSLSYYRTLMRRYNIGAFSIIKENLNESNYAGTGNDSRAMYSYIYKSSNTSSMSYGGSCNVDAGYFKDEDAGTGSGNKILRIRSRTKFSVYVVSTTTTYGFVAGIEYTYHMVYSS